MCLGCLFNFNPFAFPSEISTLNRLTTSRSSPSVATIVHLLRQINLLSDCLKGLDSVRSFRIKAKQNPTKRSTNYKVRQNDTRRRLRPQTLSSSSGQILSPVSGDFPSRVCQDCGSLRHAADARR